MHINHLSHFVLNKSNHSLQALPEARWHSQISRTWLAAILSLSALGLSACSTVRTSPERGGEDIKTSSLLPVPASRAKIGTGVVLLAAEFRGVDPDSDQTCRWRVINQETRASFFITLEPDEAFAVAQLEPGQYEAGRFGCGVGRVWDLRDTFKGGFKIEDGKLSYVGKLIFEFDNGDLDTIKHAPRAESAASFIEAMGTEGLSKFSAISGFTGKPIEKGMVEIGESRDGFDVAAKGVNTSGLNSLVVNLTECSKEEVSADPLRFGRLDYLAIYKGGRFSEMKDRKEANGFSDRLRACVERGIMAYHPDKKSDVEVRVRY